MDNKIPAGTRKPEDYLKNPPKVVQTEQIEYGEHVGVIIPKDVDRAGFTESLGVTGSLTLIHRGPSGEIKHEETMENVITYSGLKYISQLVSGQMSVPFKYIQIGSGARDPEHPLAILPPDPTNVKLVAFYKEGIAVVTNAEVLNNADRGYQAIARYAYTFDFTEDVHINEACIAVDSQIVENTPILNRRTFYDRIMQPLDFLEVVWEVSFTRYPKDKVT